MLTGILQLLFNAADLIIVGRFCGSVCVAAVGATGSLTSLIVNLFIGLSVGTGVTVAHALGAGDHTSARQAVHTALPVALLCGVVLTAVGVACSGTFLGWMGTPEDVLPLSTRYMQDPQSEEILNLIFKSLSFDFSQTCSNILSGSCLRDMMRPIMSGNRNTVSSQMRSWGRSVPKRLQKINEDLEKMDSN